VPHIVVPCDLRLEILNALPLCRLAGFILLCSRGQLKLFQSQENRWFNQALDYVVVTKPIHRQALWKAVTNPKQQKPAQPRTSADSPGPQLPRSPAYSPKVRRSLSPLQWISEGEDCNILIAEDNETNILVVRSFLAALGHTAKIVRDGAACVAEFAENRRNATSSNR
jgi:PleD family two-component response regulator